MLTGFGWFVWRMVTTPGPVISKIQSHRRTAMATMYELGMMAVMVRPRNVWMRTSHPHGAIVKRACSYNPSP